MKIIVIGLGSMGKRRLRLLSERNDVELFGIDSQESRCEEVKERLIRYARVNTQSAHFSGTWPTTHCQLDLARLLEKELTGYKEYQKKVKYRLIPYIW